MNELKTFRKIVEWMLKCGKDTNHMLNIGDLTMDMYVVVMDPSVKIENLNTGLKARVQVFNKRYYEDYLQGKYLESYDDAEDEEVLAPVIATKVIPVTKDAMISSQAVNESKTKALSDERKKQRTQEKLFHDKILQLGDFCPDHMTFDISLKRK